LSDLSASGVNILRQDTSRRPAAAAESRKRAFIGKPSAVVDDNRRLAHELPLIFPKP
jgi:hypothetical protein